MFLYSAYDKIKTLIKMSGKMNDNKVKTILVIGIISVYIAVSYSIPALFMTFLIAAIFVPPAIVFVYILKEGIPLISSELRDIFSSGKEMFVISVSKEHITLEPEYK